MGFFHFPKKFILGFFFLGLTAEDRIFLRWGDMLSPREDGGDEEGDERGDEREEEEGERGGAPRACNRLYEV